MEELLSKTIDSYLDRGFGTMNKNDFEVWIFHYLMQHQLQGLSNYEISIKLKIPEQKVKRLLYESELKYPTSTDEDKRRMLIEAIYKSRPRDRGGKIAFALNDKMLRSYLENYLVCDGRFYDSSFMSNIVILSINDFLFVLDKILLTEEEKQKIIKQVKKELNEPQKLPASLTELTEDIAKGFCDNLLKNFVGKAADGFTENIAKSIKQTLNI